MATTRVYGEIPGNPPDTKFASRRDAWSAGVHRETQGGISGDESGVESIVVSGGYPDDEDYGDVIVYTGQGGRDSDTGKQIADQTLTKRNLGLARSHIEGFPVRVVRGAAGDPNWSPRSGYRYDGLYQVTDYWQTIGQAGFKIFQFRLTRIGAESAVDIETWHKAPRVATTVQRIVRNTAIATKVKELYENRCQVCGTRLQTSAGSYSEAAHIRGLGAPHHGPDTADNILCLCPNHHVLFDNGGIYVDAGWTVRDAQTHAPMGTLLVNSAHSINADQLAYHRTHYLP